MNGYGEFKNDYLSDLEKYTQRLKSAYIEALKDIGLASASEGYINVENTLEKINDLSDLGNKIRDIRHLKSRCEREIILLSQKASSEASNKVVDIFISVLDELIQFLTDTNKAIIGEIKQKCNNISNCPYGQAENSTKNGLDFEKNVIELFAWLFIDEIRLLTEEDIKQEQLIRDGIFEVLDNFDFNKRGIEKIRFGHVLIECKNYRKPSYDDLMQLYAYTLLSKVYPLVNKPLCLMVSRENPNQDSIAIRMRDKLFEKNGDKCLLVLFLSCNDLNMMVEIRAKSGDPFLVIKEHIKRMIRESITSEG